MKINKFFHILPAIVLGFSLIGCSDYLEVESNSVIETDGTPIDTEASARYAMFGILKQVQKVADRYVLMGEVRGDLLSVTDNTTQDLRDISNFEVDSLNDYHVESDLYGIINNCNYLLACIDTSVVVTNTIGDREKILKREMAQAHAFRAWSYLQLALVYGSVSYYTEPVLSVDQKVNTVEYELSQLITVLVTELEPWLPADDKTVEQMPDYGTLGSYSSQKLFIPIRLLLADLYLLQNQYEQAAKLYFAHLLSNELTVLDRRNGWSDNSFTRVSPRNWTSLFSTSSELQSVINGSSEYQEGQQHLASLFDVKSDYLLAPSKGAIGLFGSQTYAYGTSVSTTGDLRGEYGTYTYSSKLEGESEIELASVNKYNNLSQTVLLYRTSMVYLRYAEAINRLGCYNMAFALLKYGLNSETFASTVKIPTHEWQNEDGTSIPYLDFGQDNLNNKNVFSSNVGIHSRGCGDNIDKFNSFCIPSGVDSLLYVENLLIDEMALETAYEGSRFTDILRISRHRNDDTYVANKIALRNGSTDTNLYSRLLSPEKWYLPRKTR